MSEYAEEIAKLAEREPEAPQGPGSTYGLPVGKCRSKLSDKCPFAMPCSLRSDKCHWTARRKVDSKLRSGLEYP